MTNKPIVVDLSHNNPGPIDFAKAKAAGVIAVIHKASQGLHFVDPQYASRRAAARKAGLLWAAYHFATGDDVGQQVQHFLTAAAGGDAELDADTLLILDWEENPGGTHLSRSQALAFLGAIEAATGRRPVLYGGSLIKAQTVGDRDDPLGDYWLWLADYSSHPTTPVPWAKPWLLQYTDTATVPGIPGHCDASWCADPATIAPAWALPPVGQPVT